jgi:hypothetical protein
MTNTEVKIFRNSFTPANAVPVVRRPSVAKAMGGGHASLRSGGDSVTALRECFRIRNKPIN